MCTARLTITSSVLGVLFKSIKVALIQFLFVTLPLPVSFETATQSYRQLVGALMIKKLTEKTPLPRFISKKGSALLGPRLCNSLDIV
jgi:hypothetical protein